MWIFVQKTQRCELVLNPDHIARLLNEGGQEVDDPTTVQASPEQAVDEQEPVLESEQVSEIIDISKKRRRRASQ